jgi:hypothetical protein
MDLPRPRRRRESKFERGLHALRSAPPETLVTTLRQACRPRRRWAEAKAQVAILAALTVAVVAGAASAGVLGVAGSTANGALSAVRHLTGAGGAKPGQAPFTPAADQYAKPKIKITKGPNNQKVAVNGTATFAITLKDSGKTDLIEVTVTDLKTPTCSRASGTLGTLHPGDSTSYICTLSSVQSGFTNTASVSAMATPNNELVTDSDQAKVTLKS